MPSGGKTVFMGYGLNCWLHRPRLDVAIGMPIAAQLHWSAAIRHFRILRHLLFILFHSPFTLQHGLLRLRDMQTDVDVEPDKVDDANGYHVNQEGLKGNEFHQTLITIKGNN